MGKKYIIELPENTHWIQWIMEGTKDHHPYMDFKQVEDLTPYTEPDLEQVRKEAYDKGWKEAENYYDEYHVGDEFENEAGQKFVVLKMDGKEIDRYIDGDGKTYVMSMKYRVMRKTGRHFPEIAAVLEKMRGEKE